MVSKNFFQVGIYILIFFSVLIFFSSCLAVEYYPYVVEHPNVRTTFGYQIGVTREGDCPAGPILFFDDIEDVLIVEFANFSGSDAEFVMKVFLDFQEVKFRVIDYDRKESSYSYLFLLEDDERVYISFVLESDFCLRNGYASLLVMLIRQPNSFQKYSRFFENKFYGISSQSFVFLNAGFEMQENVMRILHDVNTIDYSEIPWVLPLHEDRFIMLTSLLGMNYFSFNVSANIEKLNAGYNLAYIITQPYQELTLYYFLGDITGGFTCKFVIIGLLDWGQINLNGEQFMKVQLPRCIETGAILAAYSEFIIRTPSEPGKYEFIAYAIGVSDEIDSFGNIENSFRFTIVVE